MIMAISIRVVFVFQAIQYLLIKSQEKQDEEKEDEANNIVWSVLLFCSENFLLAIDRMWIWWLDEGLANIEMQSNNRTNNGIFAVSSQVSTEVTIHPTTSSIYATSILLPLRLTATGARPTLKNFSTTVISRLPRKVLRTGIHLEALASLSGCTEQYGTFEKALYRNSYVFADKDYDGSIDNFFNILNTDEELLQCWGQS